MGDWLDELPLESDRLEEVAPEDDFDPDAYERFLQMSREGSVVLDTTTVLDQQAYQRALQEERRGQRPPGLREATGEEMCMNCTHFDGDEDGGICGLFTFSVGAQDVCDSWDNRD
jgi:hypothetical protein